MTAMSVTVVAIDLGATSGRVLSGTLAGERLTLAEHARFPNAPVALPQDQGAELIWDLPYLYRQVQAGLRAAAASGPIAAVGIDSWAVDYGLLDRGGRLLANPACYRSERTAPALERTLAALGTDWLYAESGLQLQPFNTVFQLLADRDDPRRRDAAQMLLLPDLLAYWLTGARNCEVTNASTTGLIDPRTRRWSTAILDRLHERCGVELAELLPSLIEPGGVIGEITQCELGLRTADGEPTPLVAVGSHDTASAVLGVPATDSNFAYVSAGTWSLVGVELVQPVLSEAARAANFTNELGVDRSVRFLKNVTGSWITEQLLNEQRDQGQPLGWTALDAEAAAAPALRTLFDVNDPRFAAPGAMTARIDDAARESGQPLPASRGQYLRASSESLALAQRQAINQAAELTGISPSAIHIVGGGSRNPLLCQATADATGCPVLAGPVEATAIGNMLLSLRACGALRGGRAELRQVVFDSFPPTSYQPDRSTAASWARAAVRMASTRLADAQPPPPRPSTSSPPSSPTD